MLREAVPLGRFLDLGAMFALWKFGSDRQCLFRNRHIVEVATRASELVGFVFTRRLGLWPFLVYRAVAAGLGERRTLELSLTGRVFGPGEARDGGPAPGVGGKERHGGV